MRNACASLAVETAFRDTSPVRKSGAEMKKSNMTPNAAVTKGPATRRVTQAKAKQGGNAPAAKDEEPPRPVLPAFAKPKGEGKAAAEPPARMHRPPSSESSSYSSDSDT